MRMSNNGFRFVLYPKYLIHKGIYNKPNLPSYGMAIFRDNIKEDQITIVPEREQHLYQTYFLLNQGKLQFKVMDSQLNRQSERKVVIYDHGQELGWLVLNIEEYIGNYQDTSTKYFQEQLKLTETIQFTFQLFLASTDSQLSELLMEYKGISSIKTPMTILSNKEQEEEDIDKILSETKVIHSELYSPAIVPSSRKNIHEDDDEEEESLHSSIPLTSPAGKNGFSINLRAVPVKNNQQTRAFRGQSSTYKEYLMMPGADKLMIFLFGVVSIGMIYLSMFPIKKI